MRGVWLYAHWIPSVDQFGFIKLLRDNVAMHQRFGVPSFILDAEDVHRLAPSFVSDDFGIAAY